jgi:hypothetical protein
MAKLEPAIWIRESSMLLRAIDSTDEALLFLANFHGDRGGMYFHAKSLLGGARDGTVLPSDARQAFWAFAQDNKLLGESAAA